MAERKAGTVLLAAGGSGGHLFPAEALAHELDARGFNCVLMTDKRAEKFATGFPPERVHVVASATFASKNPIALMKTAITLCRGYLQARRIVADVKPLAAVGFGGYPTFPPIIASHRAKVPILLHEQNAILGRANRFLSRFAKGIATGFKQVGERPAVPVLETGNPLRPPALRAMEDAYPSREVDDPFRLVIFGGSQGARFFSQIMPDALGRLSGDIRNRFSILQQARPEDADALRKRYADLGVTATIAPFFNDLPQEIARAHFVIARAGAGSVAELALIGRPSILVPLPGSLDGDQAANAQAMQRAGGGHLVRQSELTGERLASLLSDAIDHPETLSDMAAKAKTTGIPDAARRLADCVECVISGGDLNALTF